MAHTRRGKSALYSLIPTPLSDRLEAAVEKRATSKTQILITALEKELAASE